ncbi:MAG: class I SAM-dependent methyltransferase [Mailhella sp.]|nr:class I SAM-dependent methyltransferase [Mailhella sp.]
MIEQKDVIEFFDRLAPGWDAGQVTDDGIVAAILDNACVAGGQDILDVACGTGVMIPHYLERGAASVTAVDISPEMARIAREKFSVPGVTVLCGDVETLAFERRFDRVAIYNAFPHFPDPERLIRRLASLLRPGGVLTVAHGMSREKIDAHHRGAARHVSNGLMPAEELAEIFGRHLHVTAVVSDENMYQVAGRLQ